MASVSAINPPRFSLLSPDSFPHRFPHSESIEDLVFMMNKLTERFLFADASSKYTFDVYFSLPT